MAHDARAFAKLGLFVLVELDGEERVLADKAYCSISLKVHGGVGYHLGQAPGGDDITRVHQAVQMAGGLFDSLAHLVVAVEVEYVGD